MRNFIKDFISYYWGASNKKVFYELSKDTSEGAFKIYRLAKGKKAKSRREVEILRILRERGVISGIKYKYKQ